MRSSMHGFCRGKSWQNVTNLPLPWITRFIWVDRQGLRPLVYMVAFSLHAGKDFFSLYWMVVMTDASLPG